MKNLGRLPGGVIDNIGLSALAPMQDVTHLPFMKVISRYGVPDYFFTEYFRVHGHSTLEKHILESIVENPSERPVFGQLIGEDEEHMVRTVKALVQYPVAGVDLNMGCPAPKVYKKNVGGGLLRDLNKVDSLLGALRDSIQGLFTVKMRIGFADTENFEGLLNLINKHNVDLLSLHGRTVKEGYRSEVHYDLIKRAGEAVRCPVLANGNIGSVEKAQWVMETTQVDGVMVGRGAIRNPWIFRQLREHWTGQEVIEPSLKDVYQYIEDLYHVTEIEGLEERLQVNRMKKYLNFIGQGVDPEGLFLQRMRRSKDKAELFGICEEFLLSTDKKFESSGFEGVVARPNCEVAQTCSL